MHILTIKLFVLAEKHGARLHGHLVIFLFCTLRHFDGCLVIASHRLGVAICNCNSRVSSDQSHFNKVDLEANFFGSIIDDDGFFQRVLIQVLREQWRILIRLFSLLKESVDQGGLTDGDIADDQHCSHLFPRAIVKDACLFRLLRSVMAHQPAPAILQTHLY